MTSYVSQTAVLDSITGHPSIMVGTTLRLVFNTKQHRIEVVYV
jgi:hypothetical protein